MKTKQLNSRNFKPSFGQNVRKYWQLYLFLLVPLIYILIFAYGPMMGLQIAFKDFDASKGIFGSDWVGIKYFTKFIHSYQFGRIIRNTFLISIYSLTARFPVPILIAICINVMRSERYKKATQMIIYVPHFISVVVLIGMLNQFFNPFVGLYGNIYKVLFHASAPDVLTNPSSFLHMYVWSGIWQNMGWDSIIYIAALSSVPQELHEAAQIDGATRLKRVVHIDLPAIRSTVIIMLILNIGQLMNLGFEKIFLMQNNVNLRLSEVISTYTYKEGISSSGGNYSYATAIGLFNSVVNFVLVVTVNKLAQKYDQNGLW